MTLGSNAIAIDPNWRPSYTRSRRAGPVNVIASSEIVDVRRASLICWMTGAR